MAVILLKPFALRQPARQPMQIFSADHAQAQKMLDFSVKSSWHEPKTLTRD